MNHHLYNACNICPKKCGVDRNNGIKGLCGETSDLRIAWAGLHFGEEPVISGKGGSGTIFITGCNLGCTFCQNFQISKEGMGKKVDMTEFADICLELQAIGAENINIVTGSHVVPAIADALKNAITKGLKIPILWNSSAYELPETIKLLEGVVSIWLPDLKILNTHLAKNTLKSSNYPEIAQKAIMQMCNISKLKFHISNETKLMSSGVIVRHLALPGQIGESERVLTWFAKNLKRKALLSVMTQYTPVEKNTTSKNITSFDNRLLQPQEDDELKNILSKLKIDDGFYQMLEPDYSWLPDFNKTQTFSSELSKPIWHWKEGFIK